VQAGASMKNIDIKSLIIGALLTSTIIFGMGATKPNTAFFDAVKPKGKYLVAFSPTEALYERPDPNSAKGEKFDALGAGWEPFAVSNDGKRIFVRKIVK
jgi:hypothetical protein